MVNARISSDSQDHKVSFSELYDGNYRRILNYIAYHTGDIELALDLTSETFFKALRAYPRYEERGMSPTPWLFRIASREIAMHRRKESRMGLSLEFSEEILAARRATIGEEIDAASRELEECEDFLALNQYLRQLPIKYRVVIFLRHIEGMSFEEISRLLDRPTSTVRSQNRRALKSLGKMMQRHGSGEHLLEGESDPVVDRETQVEAE